MQDDCGGLLANWSSWGRLRMETLKTCQEVANILNMLSHRTPRGRRRRKTNSLLSDSAIERDEKKTPAKEETNRFKCRSCMYEFRKRGKVRFTLPEFRPWENQRLRLQQARPHTPSFLFEYGTVVIWGIDLQQEQHFLNDIANF